MKPAAKSLILDLLATLRPGDVMPVGVLVEAGALFAISGNSIRVAAARLLAEGRIARDERGSYRLGDRSLPVGERVRSWRGLGRRTRAWKGGWIAVHTGGSDRAGRRGRQRALRWIGLAPLREGLWLRPDNLVGSVETARRELQALGLPSCDLVFAVADLDAESERAAHAGWDVEDLRAGYRTRLAEIETGSRRLAGLPLEEAMVESFTLGGQVLRQLLHDPLLPDEICPSGERDRLVAAMREYDRRGRSVWASLLDRWGVPCLRAPIDGATEERRPRLAS